MNTSSVNEHTVKQMLTYGKGKNKYTTLDNIVCKFAFSTPDIKASDGSFWIFVYAM